MATGTIPTNNYRAGRLKVNQLRMFDPAHVSTDWTNSEHSSDVDAPPDRPTKTKPPRTSRPSRRLAEADENQFTMFDET